MTTERFMTSNPGVIRMIQDYAKATGMAIHKDLHGGYRYWSTHVTIEISDLVMSMSMTSPVPIRYVNVHYKAMPA